MLKLCKVCGEYKEESEFPVHSHGRLRSTCKMCWNQRNRTKEQRMLINIEKRIGSIIKQINLK